MEHREPPFFAAGDRRPGGALENPAGGFRLRAFDPLSNRRRIDAVRLAVTSLVVLGVAALVLYAASWALSAAVGWVHRQSQYQVAFDEIQLLRDLPRWYRGGKREFLRHVRESSGNAERISQLEVRPDRLAKAFKLDPWVQEVVSVSDAPGRVSVNLNLRDPIALVKLAKGRQQVIDGEGTILPWDDIDFDAIEPLVMVRGERLTSPSEPRAGVVWKSKTASGLDEVDERIVAAARLARFLKQAHQGRNGENSSALRMVEINVNEFEETGASNRGNQSSSTNQPGTDKRGLFVFNAAGTASPLGKCAGLGAAWRTRSRRQMADAADVG